MSPDGQEMAHESPDPRSCQRSPNPDPPDPPSTERPILRGSAIAARSLVAVLTALAITVVLLAVGWAAYGAHIPGRTAPAFILDVVVGAVAFCCLGFAVASLIGNVDAAQPAVQAIVLPLSFISGIFVATSELPGWLAAIGKIFPVEHLTAALPRRPRRGRPAPPRSPRWTAGGRTR
jgi:ABC-2 type transporter